MTYACDLFPGTLDEVIVHLLENSEHEGTVVRWSAAFAPGRILRLRTPHTTALIAATEAIVQREAQNSIRKIYQAALKELQH